MTNVLPANKQKSGRKANKTSWKPGQSGNPKGAPKRGQSWRETVKRITDYTRDEAIEIVGKDTTIGRLLKELPPNIPIKDALIFSSIIAYGREPNSRMLGILMDREEGKPEQPKEPTDTESRTLSIPADLIAPSFLNVYRDIRDRKHTEYLLFGGRGSTKSSFISLVIVWLIVNNPTWHALAMRQVADTLRGSAYGQIEWAIHELGLSDKFKMTVSPLEITYIPTGQKIYFKGADDPLRIKSIKPPFGSISIAWFEELPEFHGDEIVRSITQSAIRGTDTGFIFKSYNPPRTSGNWVNKYRLIPKETQFQHLSDYRDVPIEWIGKMFIDEAEHLREVAPASYAHEYLGEVNGLGDQIFENLEVRPITDEEIKEFDNVLHGLDFGYFPHPAHFAKVHYDATRHILYVFGEVRKWKHGNRAMYDAIMESGLYQNHDWLICDSAEPKSVDDYRAFGARARGAEKGASSLAYSIKWMQSLSKIVLDPVRVPYSTEELTDYAYLRTKDGELIEDYPREKDDAIAAIRYATNMHWRRRGE